MAQNPFAQYDPSTQAYLDKLSQAQYTAGPAASAEQWSQNINSMQANNRRIYDLQRGIEWANKQKIYDPSFWQQALSGGGGGGGGTLSNLVNIEQSPAYKWRYDQGLEAVNRTAAAKGMLGSGNRLAELTKYGQGMATQEYGDEWNRQYQLKALEQQRQLAQQQNAMQGMSSMFKMMG